MSWNDERVELLKKLWSEGLSASRIAAELGDITRNAVIGKVHRLGLSGRTKTGDSASERQLASGMEPEAQAPLAGPEEAGLEQMGAQTLVDGQAGNAAQPPLTLSTAALPPEEKIESPPAPAPSGSTNVVTMAPRCTIMNLTEATCRWPIGEPGTEGFYFCGGRSITGLPYCTQHARLAYQPVQDRRRDRRLAYV